MNRQKVKDLTDVSQWLEEFYYELKGIEVVFSTQEGENCLALMNAENAEAYRASIQDRLDQAVQLGLLIDFPMPNCGLMFEYLNGDEKPLLVHMMNARSEVNLLSAKYQQLWLAEDQESADAFVLHCKTYKGTHKDKAKAWLSDHPDETLSLEQLKKKSTRIPHSK